mmetsp:Transcript_14848/g.37347  ORF Transcript_14848/g.37347 Transcript_14848/m.37347 type:complete len:296 (+) Transcript_14848:3-890(+)
MAISKASKILLVVGSLLSLAGIICIIVGHVVGAQAVEIDWKATDQSSFTLTVSGDHCGFSLYMMRGGDCDSVYSNTVITGPKDESRGDFFIGGDIDFYKKCKIDDSEMQKQENLLVLGHFYPSTKSGTMNSLTGDYKVRSSANLWAMGMCGECERLATSFISSEDQYPLSALIFISVGLGFCCFMQVLVACGRLEAGGAGSSSGSSFGDAIEDREEKTEAVETLHAEIDQLDLANLAEAVETMHAKLDQLTASVAKIVEGTTELAKACAKLDAAVSEAMEGDRPEPGATSIEELA